MLRRILGSAFLAVVTIHASQVAAQTVYGRVIDADSRVGIGVASVSLLGENGAVVTSTVTDSTGAFRLAATQAGKYRIRGERIGYAETISPIELKIRQSATVDLMMSVASIPLKPLVVRAKGLERGRDGFDRRLRMEGNGVFIDRLDVERLNPPRTTDLFRHVEGLMVTTTWARGQLVGSVKSLQGWGCFVVFHNNQVDPVLFSSNGGVNASRATGITPIVNPSFSPYVRTSSTARGYFSSSGGGGGSRVWGGGMMDVFLTPDMVEAIEIYRSFQDIPVELKKTLRSHAIWPGGTLGGCGMAIIWSRAAW